MTEEAKLSQKRDELKWQLAAGEYKTVLEIYLDGVGRPIQKLTRNPKPLPFWYSAVVAVLVTYLIGLLISLLLGENYYQMAPLTFRERLLKGEDWLILILMSGLPILILIAAKIGTNLFSTTLRDHLLDAIESVTDLTNLQHWLATVYCNVRKTLLFGLVLAILISFQVVISSFQIIGVFIGVGLTIENLILSFQIGIALAQFLLFFMIPLRLSRYQYRLYAVDPRSSEVIGYLSDMLISFVYLMALLAALFTLSRVVFARRSLGWIDIIPLLMAWAFITAFFVISQVALTKIITKAKRKILSEVQAKIEHLRTREAIPTKDTLAHLRELIDYHDHIRDTRNSAFDIRAGLNFLNSLLLPLITFILGNLDNVLSRFY